MDQQPPPGQQQSTGAATGQVRDACATFRLPMWLAICTLGVMREREPLEARGRRSDEDETSEAKKGFDAWFGGEKGGLWRAERRDELRSMRTCVRVLFLVTCYDETKR
mmetsp:Transcript_5316/g.33358  ORF Transcript_5316/g.33358 Transcript_5316/m.33358 type:complete len:108 (-) Transcript_5316:1715-2038(-)